MRKINLIAIIFKKKPTSCRYADSICLKFYDKIETNSDQLNTQSISLENHVYDICNCINVSYTPRQIMSAGSFLQVRFKTIVRRPFDQSNQPINDRAYRGYLIRYKFTNAYGIETKEGGKLDENTSKCKVYFHSSDRKNGYFSSPNYPGLYPRDIECHYYFFGMKHEKVQITFHTFDVEGVGQ